MANPRAGSTKRAASARAKSASGLCWRATAKRDAQWVKAPETGYRVHICKWPRSVEAWAQKRSEEANLSKGHH